MPISLKVALTGLAVFALLTMGGSQLRGNTCNQASLIGIPVQVTFDPSNEAEPSWSPDGIRIAFTSNRTGNQEIYAIDLVTGHDTAITRNGNRNWHPDWSPDGQFISYTGGINSDQIWISTSDGSHETPITFTGPHRHPDWSPDGLEFAYTARLGVQGPVRRINSDGTGTPLTIVTSGWYADYSPDGNRIAFASHLGGGKIYLVNRDGTNLKNISTSSDYHAYPAWSPDGSKIACSITKNGNSEIYIIDTLGNVLLQVTNSPFSDGYPAWSPCGNALAFHSNRSGNLDIWVARLILPVAFDIKPGSCPNPLNAGAPGMEWIPWGDWDNEIAADATQNTANKPRPGRADQPMPGWKAVLPAAILGAEDFDVTMIDPATIRILDVIAPLRWNYEDVATPVADDAEECECTDGGPDGYVDLTVKFSRDEIIAALGAVYDGDVIPVTVTGQLTDGTPFEGTDCLLIIANDNDEGDLDLTNSPNPFNPATTISFTLAQPSQVQLDVFNVTGQKVRTLIDDEFATGEHSVIWDGTDSSGRPVSSGIYFYRLQAGELHETKKMIMLK